MIHDPASDRLRKTLKAMYASPSWRYSAPLRSLARALFGKTSCVMVDPNALSPTELERHIKEIRRSMGWRLTRPVRLIEKIKRRRREKAPVRNDPDAIHIAGTALMMSRAEWQQRARSLGVKKIAPVAARSWNKDFAHSGQYAVSAIASLYRAGRYIETFMENITQQDYFDRSELIIVDAASPEGEAEVIRRYQRIFPNIVYYRAPNCIPIYEAWNKGISLARGRYLTNVNMDDLRRTDSFTLQANALDQNPDADLVYQDFYYSFDDTMRFDQVAAVGVQSDLPDATPLRMLEFNMPHNAPMWRRTLHDRFGLFDQSFISAGDYDFWLRCISGGARFVKIDPVHVVYFQNPNGISTHPDSAGIREGRAILQTYRAILTAGSGYKGAAV